MGRNEDREEVQGKLHRVQELKERMLEADRDRNDDLVALAERKLEAAELAADMAVEEYKEKYGKK